MFIGFYLRCVRGCDDPSAVSVVVVLDGVVWRRDDTIWTSQLSSAHRCCNKDTIIKQQSAQRMKYGPTSVLEKKTNEEGAPLFGC